MKRIISILIPPGNWSVIVIILLGLIFGISLYAFYISRAYSYLSDNPETCVNCHIMAPQYATWNHSSHRGHADCNDCHVPHNNTLNKYFFKAKDGLRHATIFTLRKEPQVIFIREEGQNVVQKNCVRCHSQLITDTRLLTKTMAYDHYRQDRTCWDCHREVPHGRVNSLSSVPNTKIPLPESPVPEWMKTIMKNKKE